MRVQVAEAQAPVMPARAFAEVEAGGEGAGGVGH